MGFDVFDIGGASAFADAVLWYNRREAAIPAAKMEGPMYVSVLRACCLLDLVDCGRLVGNDTTSLRRHLDTLVVRWHSDKTLPEETHLLSPDSKPLEVDIGYDTPSANLQQLQDGMSRSSNDFVKCWLGCSGSQWS